MLNDVIIKNLPSPASGVAQHPDGKIPGFGVRVTSNGVKTFYLKYRLGRQYGRINLGRYPSTTLAKARAKAHAALADIAEGINPRGEDKAAEVAERTFSATLEAFLEGYCKHQNRASTAAETERLLRSYFLPEWQKRLVSEIGKTDVVAALDPIMRRGSTSAARHAFAAARKFFNWCVEQGVIDDSPCRTMKPPVKAVSRDRVLSDAELSQVLRGAEAQGDTFGTVVRLLALTAQRRGEVCGMRWNELDFAQGVWTIPASRTKNHRPHAVPLTPTAVAIIRSIPRIEGVAYVFPARGKLDQPYSGFSKGKRTLDAATGLHDWTLHDLRRTAATGMARLCVPPHVVERILNHSTGSFGGVAGVYNRFQYLPEMGEALKLWEAQLASISRAADGNERLPDK